MRLDKVGVQEQRELLKGSCFLGGGNEGSDCDHRHRHLCELKNPRGKNYLEPNRTSFLEEMILRPFVPLFSDLIN